MILAVNIGNTNINLGLFKDEALSGHFCVEISRFHHDNEETKGVGDKIFLNKIDDIVIASVNPDAEVLFCKWLKNRCAKIPLRIGIDIQPKIPIKVKNPERVGIDRIVNAIAAYRIVNKDLIVVDAGTAITFDVVSKMGEYLGGVIAPGLKMCANALHTQTALLPPVKVVKPEKVIGIDTEEAMISGIYWGCVGAVKVILERLFDELGCKPPVFATGGDASLIAGSVEYINKIIPSLTLDGIRIVYTER